MAALQQLLLRINSGAAASCSSQDRWPPLAVHHDLRTAAVSRQARTPVRMQPQPLRAVRADKAADQLDQATLQLIADITRWGRLFVAYLHRPGRPRARHPAK